jgi:hypothetical protein
MAIARRDLLGIGAAVALTAAAASCSGPGRTSPFADRPPLASKSPTALGNGVMPRELPNGSLYYGASLPYDRSLTDWEDKLGARLALRRSYFTPDPNESAQLVARCRSDLAHRRLPHVSVKPPGTWREIANGQYDDWLASMLGPLGNDGLPLIFTLNHEPENDAGPPGMGPSDFVAMQRHAIRLAADLAPQVLVVPVLQQWTFDRQRGDDIDPAAWLVPDADVMGLDAYNLWSPMNRSEWRSFGSKLDEAIGWFEGRRLVIGEYGCRINPQTPGLAAEWLRDAADYARTNNFMSMSYFSSPVDADEGSWELTGETESAFAELLASDWVARPPVPEPQTKA